MLVKSIPGVNLTNILQAAFWTKVFGEALMCLQFVFVLFWRKYLGTKATCKMLIKLTTGVQKQKVKKLKKKQEKEMKKRKEN